MTARRSKTELQSRVKKLLLANTPPRKIASQPRRRIIASRASYQSYQEAYGEATAPESPRSGKDKLKIVIWVVLVALSFLLALYFASQGYSTPG